MLGRNRRIARRGFTLIELLVVIAIIGILAAMLFPVFARARESARKTQCLANVKNIAMAMQIYLTDYDALTPYEHNQAAYDYFYNRPGRGSGTSENCNHAAHANPYLRVAVILDEYIKSREVWKCPSAKMSKSARWIVPDYDGGYLQYLKNTEGEWGRVNPSCHTSGGGGPCCVAWPPGWGGSVTDSIAQQMLGSGGNGAMTLGIGWSSGNYDLKTSAIDDPSWYVVCADVGAQEEFWMASLIAMPDACRTGCGPSDPAAGCCSADWSNCSDSRSCGIDWTQKKKLFSDSQLQKPWTRHLGGSNLGFADGHAKWLTAGAIIAESPTIQDTSAGHLRGVGCIIDACG